MIEVDIENIVEYPKDVRLGERQRSAAPGGGEADNQPWRIESIGFDGLADGGLMAVNRSGGACVP
ncbi:hypothetical protein GCM10017581_038820 [Dactylosporangium matsuzakiense]|uniref:Uncharacterized protein n=1 Tax=Dactylosporangium matsuzakiense TaxID=53360 RepID=A0A9W6NLN3_9ACTN|nr:hypothetical protein GCM10017581_038820 [Dactylosporangium matsuzakiense]